MLDCFSDFDIFMPHSVRAAACFLFLSSDAKSTCRTMDVAMARQSGEGTVVP